MTRRLAARLTPPKLALDSIVGRQIVMIASVALPILLFAVIVVYFYAATELRQLDQQRLATVRAVSEAINRQIEVEEATLKALRASEAFQNQDWRGLFDRATRLLGEDPIRRVLLFGEDGAEIFNTLRPFGQLLPSAAGQKPLQDALQADDAAVSDLVMGAVSKRYILGVYLAARGKAGEAHVIAMGFGPELIQRILDLQTPPPGARMSVIDRQGRIIARTIDGPRSIGQPASADYIAQAASASEGSIITQSIDGVEMRAAYSRSARTGWTVGIAVEAAAASEGLRESLYLIGGGGSFLVLLAVAAAAFLANQTTRAITGLANAARALGRGEALPPLISDLREVNAAGEAIAAADVQLRRTAVDLAERGRELHESEARYRLIADNMRDMILLVDREGVARYVSPSSLPLLGRPADEVIGHPVVDLVEPPDRDAYLRFLEDMRAGLAEAELRHRARRADGSLIWVEMGAQALIDEADGAVTGFIAGLRDVTARKLAEDHAAAAIAAAEAANRAKSDFLAHMSHELRTPLNAVIGFAQLLTFAQSDNLNDKQRQYIDHIVTAGGHLLRLVTDLLDLAKIDAGELRICIEPTPIEDVLSEVDMLSRSIAEKAGVSLRLVNERSVTLAADRSRLVQVLLNLCVNAIKYNRRGGSVAVVVEDVNEEISRIRVEDDGIGISEENQQRLFQPFLRFSPTIGGDGSGIGLSISKRLIQLMGGVLGCSSVLEQGSVFWIDLPRARN